MPSSKIFYYVQIVSKKLNISGFFTFFNSKYFSHVLITETRSAHRLK